MTYVYIILIIVIAFIMFSNNEKFTNPQCGKRIVPHKYKYLDSYTYSNIENAFDCYNNCINGAKCGYVGLGFDCYDNCFNYFENKDNDPLVPTPPTTIEKF